jgi:hypothetical protein
MEYIITMIFNAYTQIENLSSIIENLSSIQVLKLCEERLGVHIYAKVKYPIFVNMNRKIITKIVL